MTDTIGSAYEIKVSRVKPNPDQPRKYFSQDALESLADSIHDGGQEVAISVEKNAAVAGEFLILDGERRWRALNIIWKRTDKEPTIKAFVTVVKNRKEFFRRSVVANLHREDLSDLDEAAAITKLREDMSAAEIAKLLDKSIPYVTNRLKLDTLPEAVKALMHPDIPKERRLSVTTAIDVATSTKDDDLRLELAKEAVERSLGSEDSRVLIAIRTGSLIADSQEYRPKTFEPVSYKNEYKKMTSLIGRMRASTTRFNANVDVQRMYNGREDPDTDRAFDAQRITNLIIDLEKLRDKIRGN